MCTDAVRGIESVQGANCFKVEHRGKILYHEYGSSGISGLRHGVPQLVQEILNPMDVPWSNGFIEGCNNKTKVLKRVCFGMRNFRNFRNRILFCSGVPKKPRRG